MVWWVGGVGRLHGTMEVGIISCSSSRQAIVGVAGRQFEASTGCGSHGPCMQWAGGAWVAGEEQGWVGSAGVGGRSEPNTGGATRN